MRAGYARAAASGQALLHAARHEGDEWLLQAALPVLLKLADAQP